MKRIFLTIWAMILASVFSASAEIKVTDSNVLAGKSVNVLIERKSNSAEKEMYVVVYSYNAAKRIPEINEKKIMLSSSDNNITTVVQIPTGAEFVVIKSHTEGYDFAKDETCPVIVFQQNGNAVKNSYYFKSLYDVSGLKQADDVPINYAVAEKDLLEELKIYPNNALGILALTSLRYDIKKITKENAIEIAESYRKMKNNLGNLETQMLIKIYSSLGLSATADSISKEVADSNPTGSIAEQKFMEILNQKDGNEFINLSNMFSRQFPDSEYLNELRAKSVSICMKNELYDEAVALMKKNNFYPSSQALYLAFIYLEKQNSRQKAESLFNDVISGLKSISNSKTDKSMTDYEWNSLITSELAEVYRAMGEFYLQLKEKDLSIRYFTLAKKTYKTLPQKIYENLTRAYYFFRMDKEAFNESEEAILQSASNVKILDINEKLFSKQKIKMKYKDYLDSLNSIATARREEKLSNKMISVPMMLPTLNTVDNLAIDLKSFKGDVLVIDLFATWCQPCEGGLASIVNISKTEFLSDKISFFAVDCLENEEVDKSTFESEDFGRVTILYDNDNAFSHSLGIKGLPTRLFFDRNGNLSYVIRGASGQTEDIRETQDVINLLLKK